MNPLTFPMASQQITGAPWRQTAKDWLPPVVLTRYRRWRGSPPPVEDLRDFRLPERPLERLFPGIERHTIAIPASQALPTNHMIMPAREMLTLGAICRHLSPGRVFEFGTYTGASTLVMAMNAPDESRIDTLDLDPAELETHEHGLGVGGIAPFEVGGAFRSHPAGQRIRQLFGNSLTFDFTPFTGGVDLVLVDADHSYRFVSADSEHAFRMLAPGGVIVWDDYAWDPQFPECVGVTRYLNELMESRPCFRIEGTRLAIHIDDRE